MSDEWSDWIEWGGKGAVPNGVKAGDWYQGIGIKGQFVEKRVERNYPENWKNIERFRLRKPRGLTMLEEIAKGIREPVGA
jgi:hypothetical protein